MSETVQSYGAAALAQPKSVFDRILGIFINPRETMEDIVARPSWIIPLALILISTVVSVFFLQELILDQAVKGMTTSNPNMTQEQIDQALPFIKTMTWVSVPLAPPIMYLIFAGLFLFVGNVILGGQTNFKTAFSVVCWSGLISILGSAIMIPALRAKGEMTSITSLSFLESSGDQGSPIYFLLSQIDLFSLWWLVVLGLGFAAAYKFASQKGLTTAFVVWGIFLVIGTALKAIF